MVNNKIYIVVEFLDIEKYLKLFDDIDINKFPSNGSIMHMTDSNPRHDYIISKYDLLEFYDYFSKIAISFTIRPTKK